MGICGPSDRFNLRTVCVRPAIANILGNRDGKQKRFLKDQPNCVAQAFELEVTHIVPADKHAAFPRIHKARYKIYQRCLSRPRDADDRHRFADSHLQ